MDKRLTRHRSFSTSKRTVFHVWCGDPSLIENFRGSILRADTCYALDVTYASSPIGDIDGQLFVPGCGAEGRRAGRQYHLSVSLHMLRQAHSRCLRGEWSPESFRSKRGHHTKREKQYA